MARSGARTQAADKPGSVEEPLAEWEQELLTGGGSDGASLGGETAAAGAGSAPASTSNGTQQTAG